MRQPFVTTTLLCALLLAPAAARAAWTPEQEALFGGAADEYVYFSDGVGVVLGVAGGAEQPIIVAKGLADVDDKTPLTGAHVFRIGSISKTFVACAVLQLVEEGRLSLDDTLDKWYPAYPDAGKATVRMLLNMTTGFRDFLEVSGIDYQRTDWTPEDLIALSLNAPAYFEPGAAWAYSNTNYVFLGAIVQKITGHTIGAELRSRIFDKVGLAQTWFDGEETVTGTVPRGYMHSYGTLYEGTYLLNAQLAWAAGAIVSSGADLITYARALFDGTLLSQGSIAQMIDFIHVDGAPVYGLGVMHSDTVVGQAWGHNGSVGSFTSLLLYVPDKDLYVTVLNNSDNSDQGALNDEALLVATGAPTFRPKDCQPDADFLKVGDDEDRLVARFKGVINEIDPAPAYYRMGFGYAQFDRYGAIFDTNACADHAFRFAVEGTELVAVQSSCWEGGRYNPDIITGRMYRVTVPRTLLEAAKASGQNEIAPDDKTSVEIWDVDYDLVKAVVARQCVQARLDRTGSTKLFACNDATSSFTPGDEISFWATAALDTNIPLAGQCTCLNEQTGAYDPCPIEIPDAGTPDTGVDAGVDTGHSDGGEPDGLGFPDSGGLDGGQPVDAAPVIRVDAASPDDATAEAPPEGEAGGCGCSTITL